MCTNLLRQEWSLGAYWVENVALLLAVVVIIKGKKVALKNVLIYILM